MGDDAEAAARKVAEAAMQGWKAVNFSSEDVATLAEADSQGTDLPALQRKYGEDDLSSIDISQPARSVIVPMQASAPAASGPTQRNVVVSGGRVVAIEG